MDGNPFNSEGVTCFVNYAECCGIIGTMAKKWIVPSPAPNLDAYDALIPWVAQSLQRAGLLMPPEPRSLARLVGQMLANRGIAPEQAAAYFDGTADRDSPFQLKGMNETVARVRRALKAGEKIAV